MKFNSLSFLALLVLAACSDSNDDIKPILVDETSGIHLTDLQSGQKSYYRAYTSECNKGFSFTGDTLVIEVKVENDTFYLEEFFTQGSPSVHTSQLVKHRVVPSVDYVLIPERSNSRLLFFYGNDTIHLSRNTDVLLTQSGCRLMENNEPFIGESIGRVENFEHGSIRIQQKKGVSCVPVFYQMEAYIFYEENLNLVHTITEAENTQIRGYMAINVD